MGEHEESEAGYSLVMPFVVCTSKGGPYDDASFVAGVWFGKLDAQLTHAAETHTLPTLDFPVPTPLVPQLDLLAMHHGFTMDSEPWDEAPDEHTFVTFTPIELADGASGVAAPEGDDSDG